MPAKRRRSTRPRDVTPTELGKLASAAGRSLAKQALEMRAKQRRASARKHAALRARPQPRRGQQPTPARAPQIPARTRALLGPRPDAGVLIAEGDSWFDYPGQDVLRLLEDDYRFEVESVAHKGDRVEDMAHAPGQFVELARRLEKLLRDGKVPRAILLSGGGNDIAGAEFAVLLNHAASNLPSLNADIVRGLIDVRLYVAYSTLVSGVTAIAQHYLQRPLPIVTHGYDYALPDGRGFLGGFWFLPGPWLAPGFRAKGHADFAGNKQVVGALIDQFNEMLKRVSAQFTHVHHLDLRGTLRQDAGYKSDWSNELHPTAKGFDLITKKFAELIQRL